MTRHEKDFELEDLDHQIEQPTFYLDEAAKDLVEDLTWMYQPRHQDSQANARSLQRVQMLLEKSLQQQSETSNILPVAELRRQRRRDTPMLDEIGRTTHSSGREKYSGQEGKSRRLFTRWLSSVAALLVMVVLIGSVSLVLYMKKDASMPSTSVSTTLPATPTPLPELDCLPEFSYISGEYSPDKGEQAVCLQGKELPLQNSTTINGRKLRLISAYVDVNRTLIKYSISGDITRMPGDGASIIHLSFQSGSQVYSLNQISNYWLTGGSTYYNKQKDQTIFLASFPTPQQLVNAPQLNVTVDFRAGNGTTLLDPSGLSVDDASFTFTIPFQAEARIALPNQNFVINGHSVVLTQVHVTASSAYLYVKPSETLLAPPAQTVSATVNGKIVSIEETTADGKLVGKGEAFAGWSIRLEENLLKQGTTWTLIIHSTGSPLGIGDGNIQFTVPPIA